MSALIVQANLQWDDLLLSSDLVQVVHITLRFFETTWHFATGRNNMTVFRSNSAPLVKICYEQSRPKTISVVWHDQDGSMVRILKFENPTIQGVDLQ